VTRVEQSRDRRIVRTMLVPAALLLGLLLLAGTSLLAALSDQPFGHYSRDVKALSTAAGAALPLMAGGLALLNMMVWASAGAMAVLAAVIWPPRRRWLLGFALLTILLALDDALLLHEEVGPALGLPEKGFYLLYAAIGVLLLWGAFRPDVNARAGKRMSRFRAQNLSPGGRAFVLGLLLLGVSVVVDQTTHGHYLWEDAPKLLGALVWLTVPLLELPSNVLSGGRASEELPLRWDDDLGRSMTCVRPWMRSVRGNGAQAGSVGASGADPQRCGEDVPLLQQIQDMVGDVGAGDMADVLRDLATSRCATRPAGQDLVAECTDIIE
jgi:hypothetical protein